MKSTNTSVLARRQWISSDYSTLPYEAGWASEAVFFIQAEPGHPELTCTAEVSPDGINWVPHGLARVLGTDAAITVCHLTVFGNWLRLNVVGAGEDHPARVLIHLNLKG